MAASVGLLVAACSQGELIGGLGPSPTGSLVIGIQGLPSGAAAAVTVSSNQGYSQSLTTGSTLTGLHPGSYTVVAEQVVPGGDRYAPAPESQTVSVVADAPANAVVAYVLVTGRLEITIDGMPAGQTASVQVTGPAGFSHSATASETLSGLVPGNYVVQAGSLIFQGDRYDPSAPSQTVAVAASGAPTTAAVHFALATGRLALTVDGLPPSAAAQVGITGPGGYDHASTAGETLTGLAPGTYTVAAAPVSAGGQVYSAAPAQQTVTVSVGTAPAVAGVHYTATLGALTVDVSGLPAGTPADVSVSGPGGFQQLLLQSQSFAGLTPGTYTVSAASVVSGGTAYAPAPPVATLSVTAGSTAVAGVAYAPVSNGLTVTISGLPGGVPAAVTVSGPGGFVHAVASSQTLSGLVPGGYTVTAASVGSGGASYLAAPPIQAITVGANGISTAAVAYALQTGSLTVTVSGLPGGTPASVLVQGPSGFAQTLTATQTLNGIAAGSYTITAAGVTSGGWSYAASPASQSKAVPAGGNASASVGYAITSGNLDVTVSGLPGGVNASVAVTGPGGYSQNLIASQTLTGLFPGSYTVAAASVSSGGTTYLPSPASQGKTVSAGTTASASIGYAPSGGSSLDLSINAVILTQAVQRLDGSVPIVAGRDAYLRVFAVANQFGNSAQPQVRVRLYNGASLIQTYTVNAPGSGTPVAPDQSSLAASWNVMVPGALVQPGLKVLADVDPSGAIAENDETNNQFPISGVAASVDVRALPTFQLRFVPVLQQVNGLQGNVTAGNQETFLGDLKKMLPVADYNADVRTPYTTTAPVLQSDNANNAWSSILSEMLALKSADASTRYYYGVVKTGYSSGVAGLGYVGGGARTAIGWDLLPSGINVMAHEVGHNLGRQHAPCGGPAGPDPNFPYAGGQIGQWGLDLTTLTVKGPTVADLMSYCKPTWISDYNWSAMIAYRQGGPNNAPEAAWSGGSGAQGLLIWGRITGAGIVLEPAFTVPASASAAPRPGADRLELLGPGGAVLRSLSFEAAEIADLPGGPERHFAFVVPVDQALAANLAAVRVESGSRTAVRQAQAAAADPAESLTRPNPRQIEVRWDAARYPMVMVRDAATGELLSFARGGTARLWSQTGRSFVLQFSDGVRTTTRTRQPLQ